MYTNHVKEIPVAAVINDSEKVLTVQYQTGEIVTFNLNKHIPDDIWDTIKNSVASIVVDKFITN